MMKLAIMQPYIFPYIGYFQMVNAVDKFVFYDDVNYINRGWINRNRILIQGVAKYLTIPLIKASQNKLINEIEIDIQSRDFNKIIKTIEMAYKRAPYFTEVFEIVHEVLEKEYGTIADMAMESVKQCAGYLGLKTKFCKSSEHFSDTKGLEKAERLQAICKRLDADVYINAIGGQELYSKEDFAKQAIDLYFIKSLPMEYKQFKNKFVPWLSIIDVMMFNSKEEINEMLNKYELI
ncbi:MAG: WbqC-like protein family protein [Bacteroidetes bacterium ADurb.Bin174]|nr:MAG: WbqC-like protein family protein [Bacteroidetes bacterium ADurb.Bin174]